MAAIPDVPEEIEIQLERTEFITRKVIDQVADDNNEDVPGSEEPVSFKKYPTEGGKYAANTNPLVANMY
jgi:hypothetical protein